MCMKIKKVCFEELKNLDEREILVKTTLKKEERNEKV